MTPRLTMGQRMANGTRTAPAGARAGATGTARDAADETGREDLRWNRARIIGAQALQNAGDQIVKASTVLPWLLSALGSPSWIIALLVPVRESGSMLPQAAMTPWVRRQRQRKWVWVAGAAGQAIATATMALVAATMSGSAAGLAIVAALAVFALSRALTSIASKDVLGRTVPKGQRGQITGLAAAVSGGVAVVVGLGIRLLGGDEVNAGVLATLIAVAAVLWVGALAVYATIREPEGDTDASGDQDGWVVRARDLLWNDAPFRKFVTVRALLLVSALSPPFIVSLAADQGGSALSRLGPFVVASGVAGIIGGRIAGPIADRSSRRLMVWGAALASAVIFAQLALSAILPADDLLWLFVSSYFLLTLVHTGVRVGRKTYVVDMASGDQRTEYVAVSNTAMGILLLVAGAVSSGLAQLGTGAALAFLALLGVVGVLVAQSLPEISKGAEAAG